MKKLLLALTISGLALSAVPATAHAWSPYGDDAVMGHQPAPSIWRTRQQMKILTFTQDMISHNMTSPINLVHQNLKNLGHLMEMTRWWVINLRLLIWRTYLRMRIQMSTQGMISRNMTSLTSQAHQNLRNNTQMSLMATTMIMAIGTTTQMPMATQCITITGLTITTKMCAPVRLVLFLYGNMGQLRGVNWPTLPWQRLKLLPDGSPREGTRWFVWTLRSVRNVTLTCPRLWTRGPLLHGSRLG